MSKAEKIFDKIVGTLFFLAFISLIIWGILSLSNTVSKPAVSSKITQQNIEVKCVRCGHKNRIIIFQSSSIPDSIAIECEECKWLNTRSLFEFRDTTNKQLINPKNYEQKN